MHRQPSLSTLYALACLTAMALVCPFIAGAQDDEDEPGLDLLPGLAAHYQGIDGSQLARIEETPVLADGDPTLSRHVSPGGISARWRGKLFTIAPGEYRLRVFAAGAVRLTVAGQALLDAESNERGWLVAEPVHLEYGYHALEIDYRQTADVRSMSLFWSGPRFDVERIPPRHLFHDQEQEPSTSVQRGGELVRALRCAACHAIAGEQPPLAAPALDRLQGNLEYAWLTEWIAGHAHDTANLATASVDRMPSFSLQPGEAEAIAAWLWAESQPPADRTKLDSTGNAQQGEDQFLSIGCLACHRVGGLGTTGLFDGGDLSQIAAKRSAGYFARWLDDPASVNPDHRMPRFRLTDKERGHLACYLATLGSPNDTVSLAGSPPDLIEQGRQLAKKHRCAACHTMPGEGEPSERNTIPLGPTSDWQRGCTSEEHVALDRPSYRLSTGDRRAIADYVNSLRSGRPNAPVALAGDRIMAERGCLSCHARGVAAGISTQLARLAEEHPRLASRVPAMSPPALSSVGDKLWDEALLAAVDGSAPPHRPWLDVRMPRFDLADSERRAIADFLHQQDHVPRLSEASNDTDQTPDDALRLAGARLVTSDGFGCTSCHAIGQALPGDVALAALGSDLSQLGKRMRRSWFDRWVRDPARIVPRMEMPSIQQPIRGVMNDRLDDQLAAVWHVLNLPDFNPPRPNAVRVVRARNLPGLRERAAVLTDVLEADGRVYVKPLAVGLANRHNVMFDLDAARVADWWIGDTARQHTRGKTWYWEVAGSRVFGSRREASDFSLWLDGIKLPTARAGQFATELDQLEHVERGVRFSHRLHFAGEDGQHPPIVIQVAQTITSAALDIDGRTTTGFGRHVKIDGAPDSATINIAVCTGDEYDISDDGRAIRLPGGLGDCRVRIVSPSGARFSTVGIAACVSLPANAPGGAAECELLYTTTAPVDSFPVDLPAPEPIATATLDVVPGLTAHRLPLPPSIMPTGLAWREDGTMVFSSLKGRVWLAHDTDRDGLEDTPSPLSDELAAPYGVAAHGDDVDVICKYGLLRLHDGDRDGHAERTTVLASGWGHTADYHDWAVGLERDDAGNYYVALPCQQDDRTREAAHLRGKAIRLTPRTPTAGNPRHYGVEPICAGLRFPMGLALSRDGDLLATDNQGNYNPFNELNHLLPGGHYGFINQLDQHQPSHPSLAEPAINIPHPWTRSVNGICFLETPPAVRSRRGELFGPWEGHLVGCEYDTRRLIRMSLQRVDGRLQGACYPLSIEAEPGEDTLQGPVVCRVSPAGDLYVGNMRDSGWGGGRNTGAIVRMRPTGKLPAGIAEVRAHRNGLVIDFTRPVDSGLAGLTDAYQIESYRRTSTPDYGGPDQDRRRERITAARVSPDGRRVTLTLDRPRAGFVYEVRVQNLAPPGETFFPAEAYYTMTSFPEGGRGE